MKLEDSEIDTWLASHPKWQREGDLLQREVTLSSFPAAIAYVVQAGFLAEAADHHPDLDIRWCTVRIGLTTHDADGITQKDLALAEALSALADT
ncbi:MAG: 4a-hydroxytetrahydrobiopterin dehydratase [Planctomycetota bacterium]|jgi:4a-hydroxytetrahydrobiopterin dehydratase|nr:4a-hydroxytetrahydrobiopterin dehydratase [Planctomycetota bacterium]